MTMQPLNIYMRYKHTGDELEWAFTKFSTYSSFLISYHGWRVYFSFVYPSKSHDTSSMSAYYEELFECVFDFDFKLDDEINYNSDRLAYLEKVTSLEDIPMVYLSNELSVHQPFDVEDNVVYFLKKADEQENRYATAYFNLGIYDAVYDDRVMVVPKNIASSVIKDLDRIQSSFQYNDAFIDNICQYVIQTHAIVNGIPIKTLESSDFLEFSNSVGHYLSNKQSTMARSAI